MMAEVLRAAAHWAARALEGAGILVIVVGVVAATVSWVRRAWHGTPGDTLYQDYRRRIGRVILLGLEFFVAADIVNTVSIAPTFRSVGVLGLIVLIRTFLSFSLDVELNGRWPWQAAEQPRNVR